MRVFSPGARKWQNSGLDKRKHSDSSLGLSFVLGKDRGVPVTQGRWKETKVELAFPSFLDSSVPVRQLLTFAKCIELLHSGQNFSFQQICTSGNRALKPFQQSSDLHIVLIGSIFQCAVFQWHMKPCVCHFSLYQDVAEWERRIQYCLGPAQLCLSGCSDF